MAERNVLFVVPAGQTSEQTAIRMCVQKTNPTIFVEVLEGCKLNNLKEEPYMETLLTVYVWSKWTGNRIFHAFINNEC